MKDNIKEIIRIEYKNEFVKYETVENTIQEYAFLTDLDALRMENCRGYHAGHYSFNKIEKKEIENLEEILKLIKA